MVEEKESADDALAYSIDIVDISKSFRRQTLSRKGYSTIKSALLAFFQKQRAGGSGEVTHAIDALRMRVPRGASMGVIGKNGSGKSTLLKLITGIYKPDKGSISVNGRVAALIELGAGFHPDFTGRENLYLGGVMHGLSRKEIDERFDDIVAFAELEKVIDDPVRTYSSGMFMRLGFSLAVHTNPDVLLIDEVLAVGDAAFVARCKDKISDLRREGKTLLLVSHDLSAVERWCDEVIWLHEGVAKERGEPRRVIDAYRSFIEGEEEEELQADRQEEEVQQGATVAEGESEERFHEKERWGSREIEITSVRALGSDDAEHLLFHSDDELTLELQYRKRQEVEDCVFGIAIHRNDGLLIHGSNTEIEGLRLDDLGKEGTVRYRIKRLGLLEGRYRLDVAVHKSDGYAYDYHKAALEISIRWPEQQVGVLVPDHEWQLSTGSRSAFEVLVREAA